MTIIDFAGIWTGSRYRFLKALIIGLLRGNGERNFILRRADVGGREQKPTRRLEGG